MLEQAQVGKHGAVGTNPAMAGILYVIKGKHREVLKGKLKGGLNGVWHG